MSAGKLQQQASQHMCSLKGSLLTLAILTLISFAYLSINSLQSSSSSSSSISSPLLSSSVVKQPQEGMDIETETETNKEGKLFEDEISDLYYLPQIFKLNYEAMERDFKVFIYPDGDPNTFYQTPRKLTGKYASEGYFFQNIRESRFRTEDADQAPLLYPHLLPQDARQGQHLVLWVIETLKLELARVWENDTELDISNNRISRATGHLVYQKRFYRTKFCICPGGSQVNSARIADSIHYGCVPVILSNYYDLPFNDILDWRKFSVILKEQDVYSLKQVLKNMSDDEFVALHKNLVEVQKHFQWNSPPIKYDAFHMVMYDLWLRHHVIKY
ncbi:hypothetical protein GH714_034061 [Hevea brasiliensis]|uniref:Exostosin GT47 domain-containing protein n=1 Tax=Hevea brasiliensis TaxID=3981 RepID=A0A6A6L5S1_HEVBR|nr:hypothetical protein GH714_034061 [Hevea brasiliensis]